MPNVFCEGTIVVTSGVLASMHIDPNTLQWVATPVLPQGAKHNHTSVQWREVDQRPVLVTRGEENSGDFLYDPQNRTWLLVSGMTQRPGAKVSACFIPSSVTGPVNTGLEGPYEGGRLFVFGGNNIPGEMLYNPSLPSHGGFVQTVAAEGNNWTEPKIFFLPNNKLLVLGTSSLGVSKTRLYTFLTNTWADGPDVPYNFDRGILALQLPNGNVLVCGGESSSTPLDDGAVYDWATNAWAATGNQMNEARVDHAGSVMTLGLFGGKVLIHGGGTNALEAFDPDLGTFSTPLQPSEYERTGGCAHEVKNGHLMVAFGTSDDAGGDEVAEFYDPVFDRWYPAVDPIDKRHDGYSSLVIGQDEVLAAGGRISGTAFDRAETLRHIPPTLLEGTIEATSELETDRIMDSNLVSTVAGQSSLESGLSVDWTVEGELSAQSVLEANAVIIADNEEAPTVGLIEALTDAVGSSDTELGGMGITRLTDDANEGSTTIEVETTFPWPDSGTIGIEGQAYAYTSKDNTHFYGLSYTVEGETTAGLRASYKRLAPVLDLSRERSAVDRARRAMLVDYAEGEDLNALGRNLAVLRPPQLTNDDRFREIIKAIAYNPRGTMYGLELALTGIVGEGNFEIFEDLMRYRNRVFIRLKGSALVADHPIGKAYLSGPVIRAANNDDTVTLPAGTIIEGVRGLRLADEGHSLACFTALPSADTRVEYPGASATPTFAFTGTEGSTMSLVSTGSRFGGTASGYYARRMRIQPESRAEMACMVNVPSTSVLTTDTNQFAVQMQDSSVQARVGFRHVNAGTYSVGFALAGGGFIAGAAATLNKGSFYEIGIRKEGDAWHVLVDGVIKQTVLSADLETNTAAPYVAFGIFSTGLGTRTIDVKGVRFFARTQTDYWAARGTDGWLLPEFPTRLNVLADSFVIGVDEGKTLEISGSVAVNPQGGNNNGRWIIDSILNEREVFVKDVPRTRLRTEAATPQRVFVEWDDAFVFPDDLGKQVIISGSGLGNDGTYVIERLLDDVTFADLSDADSPIRVKTTVAELTGAAFQTEQDMDWTKLPVFIAESNLVWNLSNAGSVNGLVLEPRQSLPISTSGGYIRVMEAFITDVLSAQILEDRNVRNTLVQRVPELLYEYYPFYLNDPLAIVRAFLDQLTAAGVIPDFKLA